jgi:F0F1-type ATP synthase delta subunit
MKKVLSSKNLAATIETLFEQGKDSLVMQLLETSKFSRFALAVKGVLSRRHQKMQDFAKTKIFSNSQLNSTALQQIEKSTNVKLDGAEVIIDKSIVAGAIVKSGPRKIDATLATMLQNSLN